MNSWPARAVRAVGVGVLIVILCQLSAAGQQQIVLEDFEDGLRSDWEHKSFEGETQYSVVADKDGSCLRAHSRDAASGLVLEQSYSLYEYPFLSWRWKVDNILSRGDARRKSGDDYPARVYVVFSHWIPFKTRSINYIWANRLPLGSRVPNPYFSKAVMVAVESGKEHIGTWRTVKRNVLEDYREIFGEDPGEVDAIAIMTDTDNTGQEATACYDDLRISKN